MKKIFGLPGAAAISLLLAASLLTAAPDSTIKVVPAEIDVRTTLDCSTNFLYVPGVYNLLISRANINGTYGQEPFPALYSPPCLTVPSVDPALTGNAHLYSVATPGEASVDTPLRVSAALGFPRLQPYNTPPFVLCYWGYDHYDLSAQLVLQNQQTYNLAPFWTGWPGAPWWEFSDVLPLGPDPNYIPPNGNDYGINYTDYYETPGILSITLQCPDGSSAPAGLQGTGLTATSGGDPQATLPSFSSDSGPIYLLVRSGNNYSLDLTYTTGSDLTSDKITWPIHIPNVPANPSEVVPGCAITPVTATTLSCNSDPGPCGGATIVGELHMQGEANNWTDAEWMKAFDGPAGNYRLASISAALPSDTFTAINVVPSDFFGATYSKNYLLQGGLGFGSFQGEGGYEYFQTPIYSSVRAEACQRYDLQKTFNMCPGHVRGKIRLTGPLYTPASLSPLQHIALDNNFTGTGEDAADPTLSTTSFVGATGAGGGAARVLFTDQISGDGTTLTGEYDLRLAGLSSLDGSPAPSIWNPNLLNLNFSAPDANNSAFNLQENVQVADNNFRNVSISCDNSNVNDINYCFGEVLLRIEDTVPGDTSFKSVSVSGTGTFAENGVNYSVTFSAQGGVVQPTSANPNANGLIRLFLPKGWYSFDTTVGTDNGSYNQPRSTFAVCCGCKEPVVPGSPAFMVADMTNCPSSPFTVGQVTLPDSGTNYTLSYTVNNTPPFTVCDHCSGTWIFGIPLQPCVNNITFYVTDNTTHITGTVTKTVTYSPTPPTLTCSDIVLQMPAGQSALTVDYNKAHNIQVAGGYNPIPSFNPPNLSSFPVGSTPVICGVSDCCNSNFCIFNVVVQPPPCFVITNESFGCNPAGDGNYIYSFDLSNVGSDPIAYLEVAAYSPSCFATYPSYYPYYPAVGSGETRSTAFDLTIAPGCDSQTLCFIVVAYGLNGMPVCLVTNCVNNPALPTLDCPTNVVVDCTNDFGAYVNYALPAISSLCCRSFTVSAYPPPGMFPIGVTPVTCTATDGCGHTNSCQFTVTVRGHSSNTDHARNLRHDGFAGDFQIANAIAVDAAGNCYIAGWFNTQAHFGTIALNTRLTNNTDIFLAKFGPNLSGPLWVQQAGGDGNDYANAVAVDSQGNCYVAGVVDTSMGNLSFLNVPASSGISPIPTTLLAPRANMFLAKYDPAGNLLWVAPANGQGGGNAEGLAIDNNDNCYVCGTYVTAAEFESAGGGLGNSHYFLGDGQSDAFIVRYDPSGIPQWHISSSGIAGHNAGAHGIALDLDRNVAFITGNFNGSPTFGPPFVGTTLGPTPPDTWAWAFVAQCDLSASPNWNWARQTFNIPPAKTFQVGHDGRQVGVDKAGNCYFTAYFNGKSSIADDNWTPTPDLTVTPNLSTAINRTNRYNDFLVGSFTPTGNPRWLINGNGNGDDESRALAVRTTPDVADVFVTGFLNGLDRSADGGRNIELFHYDNQGAPQALAEHLASGTSAHQSNAGRALAVDAAGCVYMTGSFTDRALNFADFYNAQNNPVYLLNAVDGEPKTFIAKYCPLCEECVPPSVEGLPPNVFPDFGLPATYPVSYTVVANGTGPLTFRWLRYSTSTSELLNPGGGPVVPGTWYSITINGNTSTLTLNSAPPSDNCRGCAHYTVIITNACGLYGLPPHPQVDIDRSNLSGNVTNGIPLTITVPFNQSYIVQYRDDLGPGGVWHDLTNGLGSGVPIQTSDPNPNPTSRFYRISIPGN